MVDRGKVAEAAEETAQAEAPHAALPAQPGQAALSDVRFRLIAHARLSPANRCTIRIN